MLPANNLLAMLADGRIPLGMQVFSQDPALIEVLGLTGFDFVMLDAMSVHREITLAQPVTYLAGLGESLPVGVSPAGEPR